MKEDHKKIQSQNIKEGLIVYGKNRVYLFAALTGMKLGSSGFGISRQISRVGEFWLVILDTN